MFTRGSLRRGGENGVVYDTEDACEGLYGFTLGPVRVNVRANMGSFERAVIGLESRAVSALVAKHFLLLVLVKLVITAFKHFKLLLHFIDSALYKM